MHISELMPYKHEDFGHIRVILQENTGEAWFVGKDICECLGIGNNRQALSYLDEDEKGVISSDTPGGKQQLHIISEPGLYSLILRSRKPEAKAFKRWITHDVIPSIRKHGGYLTPQKVEEALLDPDTLIRLATALKEERAARAAAQAALAEAKPKAQMVDAAFAKRNDQPMRLSEIVRKLNGVNTQRIKSDLEIQGILYKTKAQYRVYAKYHDSHFVGN